MEAGDILAGMAEKRIPVSVLAALGLTGSAACGPCLKMSACLEMSAPEDTGDTGDTATSDADTTWVVGDAVEAVLDSVLARRVLPEDVAARVRERRGKE
jgi:hypothetical protein